MRAKAHTLKALLLCISLAGAVCMHAQEHQTIKVKKEETFLKAEFDETNYKVIAIDRFGNPHEEAIKSYKVTYSDGKSVYEAPVSGNTFPEKTIRFFQKQKSATRVCLIEITAEDKDGHLQKLPDLCEIMLFPDCKKVKKN